MDIIKKNPAIKLCSNLGERRKSCKDKITRLNRKIKATRILKGNKYL